MYKSAEVSLRLNKILRVLNPKKYLRPCELFLARLNFEHNSKSRDCILVPFCRKYVAVVRVTFGDNMTRQRDRANKQESQLPDYEC
jgi:hypothetical protein